MCVINRFRLLCQNPSFIPHIFNILLHLPQAVAVRKLAAKTSRMLTTSSSTALPEPELSVPVFVARSRKYLFWLSNEHVNFIQPVSTT